MPHAQASPQSRNQTGHVFQRRDAENAEISAEKTDQEEAEFSSPFVELAFASLRLSLRSLRLCVESHSCMVPASTAQGGNSRNNSNTAIVKTRHMVPIRILALMGLAAAGAWAQTPVNVIFLEPLGKVDAGGAEITQK